MLSIPLNYEVEEIPSGCCGMAGSFGYEKEHIALSKQVGELVLFPEETSRLARAAEKLGLMLRGPHRAFLIQGDDELGALVDMHRKLADAKVNVLSSSGVTDGRGGYGYLVYVRGEDFDAAARTLGV